MARFVRFAVPVVAICLLANSAAFAQGQGRGRGGFGNPAQMRAMMSSPLALLRREDVQKEIRVTDDQKSKIEEIQREAFQPPAGGNQTNFQNLSDEERQKLFADMRKRGEEAAEKAVAVLSDDQKSRLKQVRIWVQGMYALTENEEVGKELKLTDDQKEALKLINEEADKKRGELFGQRGGGQNASDEERAKRREQFTALSKETDAECVAVLTDAQKSQLEKLKGVKPELDPNAGFGGPGGGRGRRGRPGNNN